MAENIESFYENFFCDTMGVAEIIEVLFGGRPRREGMVYHLGLNPDTRTSNNNSVTY